MAPLADRSIGIVCEIHENASEKTRAILAAIKQFTDGLMRQGKLRVGPRELERATIRTRNPLIGKLMRYRCATPAREVNCRVQREGKEFTPFFTPRQSSSRPSSSSLYAEDFFVD